MGNIFSKKTDDLSHLFNDINLLDILFEFYQILTIDYDFKVGKSIYQILKNKVTKSKLIRGRYVVVNELIVKGAILHDDKYLVVIDSDITYYDINTFQFVKSHAVPEFLKDCKYITIFQGQLCYVSYGILFVSDIIINLSSVIKLLGIRAFKRGYVYDDKLIIISDNYISVFDKNFKLLYEYNQKIQMLDSLLINNYLVTITSGSIRIINLNNGLMYFKSYRAPIIRYTSRDNTFLLDTSLEYDDGLPAHEEFYEFIFVEEWKSIPVGSTMETNRLLVRKVKF